MGVLYIYESPHASIDVYDRLSAELLAKGSPEGQLYHVACKRDGGGLLITEVWESDDASPTTRSRGGRCQRWVRCNTTNPVRLQYGVGLRIKPRRMARLTDDWAVVFLTQDIQESPDPLIVEREAWR